MNRNYTILLAVALVCVSVTAKAQALQSVVDDYVSSNYATLKMSDQDVSDVRIKTSTFNKKSNITNTYSEQFVNGLPVFNAIASIAIKNGEVVYATSNFEANVAQRANGSKPGLNAEGAIQSAARHFNLSSEGVVLKEKTSGTSFIYEGGAASQNDIKVRLGYAALDNGALRLAYELDLHLKNGKHWYSVAVDATSGTVLKQNDWILNCSFESHEHNNVKAPTTLRSVLEKAPSTSMLVGGGEYTVYALPLENPDEGDLSLVADPATEEASPFGWHDVDGAEGPEATITQGNNVWAFEDKDGAFNVGESPDGGDDLQFNFDVDLSQDTAAYTDAATTNLFYWNNIMHDVFYAYGFDEASGNFQETNYSDEGLGEDGVFALSQDGSATNNATFGTPPDGQSGVMRMFLWNTLGDQGNLEITTPAALAGDYELSISATFGRRFPSADEAGLEGELALVEDSDDTDPNDACEAITNAADIDGKIAVVRRGSCNFTVKVLAAQEAGAIGVILVNNNTDPIINLGGDDNPNNPILIGSGMINQTDGEALIAALIAGETIIANPTRPRFKDGSFDNGIVAHEYGHGISTRLTGGAATSNCLTNQEQMGEGWSDYFGLMLTMKADDSGTDARSIGNFALNQDATGGGIRPRPYSTDLAVNEFTYDRIKAYAGDGVPHPTGHLWATMLWDMTWNFVDKYGFDPDIYNGTGGNNMALNLVVDGLKLQACNPGFVDGRDAILAAINTADYIPNRQFARCFVWEAFAKRGLGANAVQGDSNDRSDGTEDFSVPEEFEGGCASLSTEEFTGTSFAVYPNPSNGKFTIDNYTIGVANHK